MTDVATVLGALRRHGVAAYRLDAEHVRLIPRTAVTPELVALVRQAKPVLLPILPPLPTSHPAVDYDAIYAVLASATAMAGNWTAIRRHVELNGSWVVEELAWLDLRCDRLAHAKVDEQSYRAAVVMLVSRIDELHRWHVGTALPSTSRRLNVLVNQPLPGPVTLSDGTLIENVPRFLGRLLTAVDYALARPKVAAAGLVVGVYLAQLAALGIVGEVEVVH